MRDRLRELQSRAQDVVISQNGVESSEMILETQGSLATFFAEVESIRRTLNDMEAAVRRLTGVHYQMYSSAQPSSSMRAEAEDYEGQIRSMAVRTRKQLKELHLKIPQPPSTASNRMLMVQEAALGRRLQGILGSLNAEQVRHRERSQELLQRQLKIARASLQSEGASEEAQRLLDMEENLQISIFTDHHVSTTQQARQELADIEARRDELLTLERSIREVRDLFVEISLIVEVQGEMIDRIENHVLKTSDHVETGQKELVKAEENKKSARKKKIFCISCGVITIIILIIVLIIYIYMNV